MADGRKVRHNVEAQERVCEVLWDLLRDAGVVTETGGGGHPCHDAEGSARGRCLVSAALPRIMSAFGYAETPIY